MASDGGPLIVGSMSVKLNGDLLAFLASIVAFWNDTWCVVGLAVSGMLAVMDVLMSYDVFWRVVCRRWLATTVEDVVGCGSVMSSLLAVGEKLTVAVLMLLLAPVMVALRLSSSVTRSGVVAVFALLFESVPVTAVM
mgnify:CR=1 FL=1